MSQCQLNPIALPCGSNINNDTRYTLGVKCYNDNLSVRLRILNSNIIFLEFISGIHNLPTKHFWHHARDDNLVRVMLRNANKHFWCRCRGRAIWHKRIDKKILIDKTITFALARLPLSICILYRVSAELVVIQQFSSIRINQIKSKLNTSF
jgi:hypothetical protein